VTRRRVGRWRVGLVGALALVALGLLFADAVVLTAAAVPLVYVLYGTLSRLGAVELDARRSFDRSHPVPGGPVEVTLEVENAGDAVLPDVRVVDGVPDELAVTGGSPRACVALAPGETATLSYTVVARRGEHEFVDPVVRLRSLAASERLTAELTVETATLSSRNPIQEPPLREASLPRAGTLPTDSGGSGLEFHATREYQSGDPMNRIDWRHYARTGEFVTVQYREERAVRTVLVVDARPVGRTTARQGSPTGGELCVYAAERLWEALDRADVVTSIAAVGVGEHDLPGLAGPDGLPWIGAGDRARVQALFAGVRGVVTEGAGRVGTEPPSVPDGNDETTERLIARLPPTAQVLVCSPLLDDWPVGLARALSRRNVPQVVLSPDVAGGATPGQRLTAIHRDLRLRAVERAGATTVRWNPEQPIDHALRRSLPHLLSGR
jgi:uncharacterized protein (DUF58 family)